MEASKSESNSNALIYSQECYDIMGACFAVYTDKGCGFLEAVYQECLEIELMARGIPFVAQPEIRLEYRGIPLKQIYIPDFLCYEEIVVELKAIAKIAPEHRAQLMNYLKATNLQCGILVNFGHYPKVEYERFVCTKGRYITP